MTGGRRNPRAAAGRTRPICSPAIDRTGAESRQRRFFVPKRGFSDKEKAFFMKIDFVNHVALVAEIEEDARPKSLAAAAMW